MIGSLEFLTPWAGLLVLLALVPLAALALGERRVRRVRAVLRLGAPAGERVGWRVLALVAVVALLALAAMQPVIRHRSSQPVRADAAVFVVVDTSESMSAGPGPRAPTRLAQAQRVALSVGSALGGIPLGVATFTDRVLPNVFPTADQAVFDSTVRSLTSNTPPPREVSRVATSFGALREIQPSGFFSAAERNRALLVITDGESDPFDAAAVARTLATPRTVHLVVVRVGGAARSAVRRERQAGRRLPRRPRRRAARRVAARRRDRWQLVHLGRGRRGRPAQRARQRTDDACAARTDDALARAVSCARQPFPADRRPTDPDVDANFGYLARDQETVLKRIRIATLAVCVVAVGAAIAIAGGASAATQPDGDWLGFGGRPTTCGTRR